MFAKSLRVSILFILLASMLLTACSTPTTAAPTNTPEPTNTLVPTNTPIPPTETSTPTETPTNTPVPTETPTPTPTKTPTPDYNATKTVVAKATQDALTAEIKAELETLGLPTEGQLAWAGTEDQTISVSSYWESQYDLAADGKIFENFILKVDVQWDSKSGLAGCGVIFRADGKIENGKQYQLLMMRLSGAPAWDIEYYDNGKFVSNAMGEVKYNSVMDITGGATNTFYLLADKDKLSVYANGKRMGTTSSTTLTKGKIAWLTWQESGETTCSFKNAWVWQLP